LQLENKVKPSMDSRRASLTIRGEPSACPETMKGPNEGQKTQTQITPLDQLPPGQHMDSSPRSESLNLSGG